MSTAFQITPSNEILPAPDREKALENPGFGRYFTDHMVTAEWTEGTGWHSAQLRGLAPLQMHPATAVFHYAQEIFEGLKAYRHSDGSVWLFRPEANAARFARSAKRLALPVLDEKLFLAGVEELVRADKDWVPAHGGEGSLYIRPFMFASEAFLGVRAAAQATFCIIASPAGAYFPDGPTGISLWVSRSLSRAAEGGTGAAKCGGNYATGLAAQEEARANGCEQVLYLDAAEHEWIEESGTMNICLVTSDGELLTPGLGTILEGVTRDSILALAAEHGLRPVERRIGLSEVQQRCEDGTITEIFATGTAAVITPIISIKSAGTDITVGSGRPGKLALELREHLLGIQYGTRPDSHGWMRRVA
ncbi:branched chain amino acid aminotransferase [Arthrobacter sp. SW1]|uniref:branched-chain amino acid aminotransferase n=1 Tax=Arthrobacter sp. SW1 TaxID=1920889 RepID=UPI000877E0E8|nr:branched-chain amino acid aminotransferase [Arthrobacter sp. SW1]OFI39511.1 branched chain amino acid aminotransferase [Arthrobacter sp. SW1]